MDIDTTWFIPDAYVEETDGTTTIGDGSDDFFIFIADNFEFYDELTKDKSIDEISKTIEESMQFSKFEVFKDKSFYLTIEFIHEEDIYACLGYKVGTCNVLKFAATATGTKGLSKLKNAVQELQENPQAQH